MAPGLAQRSFDATVDTCPAIPIERGRDLLDFEFSMKGTEKLSFDSMCCGPRDGSQVPAHSAAGDLEVKATV